MTLDAEMEEIVLMVNVTVQKTLKEISVNVCTSRVVFLQCQFVSNILNCFLFDFSRILSLVRNAVFLVRRDT